MRALLLFLAACAGAPGAGLKPAPAEETPCFRDADEDGFGGDEAVPCGSGAARAAGDCDDGDASVHPGAAETCDGRDEDCDGAVDEEGGPIWYGDGDGDGYGDTDDPGAVACEGALGEVLVAGDCDDADAGVFPGAPETCDGRDEDCDGVVDEDPVDGGTWYADADDDGFGDADAPLTACAPPDGASSDATDCDDADPAVWPGAPEPDCDDPVDYNCDGSAGLADADGDGWAACQDCADDDAARSPSALEHCDGVDQDCDGAVDEDDAVDAPTWYLDGDADGWGVDETTRACAWPTGYAAETGDCDDDDATISPGAPEVCNNGVDDDCDGGRGTCGVWDEMALGDADLILRGEAFGDHSGYWLSAAGDLDGDGRDDLAIGAMKSDRGGIDSGAVFVVAGGTTGEVNLSSATGILAGEAAYDRAGIASAALGDVDGDGYGDLLVGAYLQSTDGVSAGSAYLALGPVTGVSSLGSAAAKLVGEEAGDYTGISVGAPGDVDGDGDQDLLVGAMHQDAGGSSAGATYLLPASRRGTLRLAEATTRLVGEATRDYAGGAVAGLGDVDGDGLGDVGVGAFGTDWAGEDAGSVYVVGTPGAGSWSLADATARLDGESPYACAGMSLSAAGDVDGDGYGDFVVGAPFDEEALEYGGAAYLVRGPVAGTGSLADAWLKLTGYQVYELAGNSVSGGSDVDGDGWPDLLIGAYYSGWSGSYAGKAYLVRGPFASGEMSLEDADAELAGEAPGDLAGRAVAMVGDTNADGFGDVLVGANSNGATASTAGSSYLLLGGDL